MISKVTLKNFKLHTSTEIEAAPITVFIGPNNSGKSSIFQALLSLRQAAAARWRNLYPADRHNRKDLLKIDIGEYDDVVRQGEKEIQISIEGKLSVPEPEAYGPEVEVKFDIWIRDNRLVYHHGSLGVPITDGAVSWIKATLRSTVFDGAGERWKLGWDWRGAGETLPSFRLEHLGPTLEVSLNTADHFGLLAPGAVSTQGGFPPEKQLEAIGFQEFLAYAPLRLLTSLHPIFPLRGFEEWGYPVPPAPPEDLDRLTLAERATALTGILYYDDELRERLSEWLEKWGVGIKIKNLPGPRLTIRAQHTEKRSDSLFLNEGTGASQLPFMLIPIGLAPEHETISICEPEAHLHPEGQSKLMRLLLEIREDRKLQYFIETHSEHVLHALLHAVARGDLKTNQLAIYYFENAEGEAKVRPLPVNEMGQVEGGLPGFFDQSLTELTEYLDALSKKK